MHTEVLTEEGQHLLPELHAFTGFYLAGGTALALQIGHRVSVDFDFFSPEPIPRSLFAKVKQAFTPESLTPLVNNPDQLTVLVRTVKLTFLSYPFPLIIPLISMSGLSLLSVKEIGATKAYTIGRRGTYKDYVDLYFILAERHATLAEIIALADQKFGQAFNSRLFTEQLLFLDDVRDYQVEFLKAPVGPKDITAFFKDEIQELPLA
jgi:predicted nucleotidyltransferase component of viral defense system